MNAYQYESFNARNYSPEQVAATFVPNRDYNDLLNNEHTVVLGPRGSGKTTLFKMLTVEAIYSWENPMAAELRRQRAFTAIYVPTDMHWHHQLKHALQCLVHAPRLNHAFSAAAVTTNILLAAARTFKGRLVYEGTPDSEMEAKLCSALMQQWQLPKVIPCLDVVLLALKSRIAEIRQLLNQAILRNASDAMCDELPSYFSLDYLAELDCGCTAFDTICGITTSEKWALCLDELELAPTWLQELAFSQQRSTSENFLFKLSTSPIPKTFGMTDARPKQDFRLICIWNYVGRDNNSTDEQLTQSVLTRRLGPGVTPEAVFGRSGIAVEESDEAGSKYSRGSREWRLFRDASKWDESLRELLESAGVDPTDPVTDDIGVRDAILRKAKPMVLLRNAFLKHVSSGKVVRRSRKLGTIYFGREAIYRISDGNPRRLIGILGDLCDRVTKGPDGAVQKLSVNTQAEVLTRASLQFVGYIRALPGSSVPIADNRIDLDTLIQSVANYFRERLFGPRFELDPVGSFRVDSHLHADVVELLRLGVYHGAFVHVDPEPDAIEASLRGKRFRLSFMLAPTYRLPLTLHDPISLSSILRASGRLRVKRVLQAILSQQELPLELSVKA